MLADFRVLAPLICHCQRVLLVYLFGVMVQQFCDFLHSGHGARSINEALFRCCICDEKHCFLTMVF